MQTVLSLLVAGQPCTNLTCPGTMCTCTSDGCNSLTLGKSMVTVADNPVALNPGWLCMLEAKIMPVARFMQGYFGLKKHLLCSYYDTTCSGIWCHVCAGEDGECLSSEDGGSVTCQDTSTVLTWGPQVTQCHSGVKTCLVARSSETSPQAVIY